MKTNESIVVIPNGEAYGRIYTASYLQDSTVPGSVLLAIIMTEQVKRQERKDYDRNSGNYVVVEPELTNMVPTFVFGIKNEAHQTELEAKLIEAQETITKLRGELYTEQNKAREDKKQLDTLTRELELKTNQATRWAEANETLNKQLGEIRTRSQTLERDLGKIREQIGKKAFDEALVK